MNKSGNCQFGDVNLIKGFTASENSLGGEKKIQGVDYIGKGEIIFTSKIIACPETQSTKNNGKINVVDFGTNSWAQHEDMREFIEQEETNRKFKSYNENSDWKRYETPKAKLASSTELVTPQSRPSSILNPRKRSGSNDTSEKFRVSTNDKKRPILTQQCQRVTPISSEYPLKHKGNLKNNDPKQDIGLRKLIDHIKSSKINYTKQSLLEDNERFKSDQNRFHQRIELIKGNQPSQGKAFTSTVISHKRCFSGPQKFGPEHVEDAVRHNTTDPRCMSKNIFNQLNKKKFERYDPDCDPKRINEEKFKKHQIQLHIKNRQASYTKLNVAAEDWEVLDENFSAMDKFRTQKDSALDIFSRNHVNGAASSPSKQKCKRMMKNMFQVSEDIFKGMDLKTSHPIKHIIEC